MKIIQTPFAGLLILEPKVFDDSRGYFYESYNKKVLEEAGVAITFIQDNQSSSQRGVLRGMHFQKPPHAQSKLIRVLSGTILDVVVDLRQQQPTFGKHYTLEISAESKLQLLVPKGFAHGFLVKSELTEVLYKCDEYYHPGSEAGIRYNDPSLGIDWEWTEEPILSPKDKALPLLSEIGALF